MNPLNLRNQGRTFLRSFCTVQLNRSGHFALLRTRDALKLLLGPAARRQGKFVVADLHARDAGLQNGTPVVFSGSRVDPQPAGRGGSNDIVMTPDVRVGV
jgi:hypothetical protein